MELGWRAAGRGKQPRPSCIASNGTKRHSASQGLELKNFWEGPMIRTSLLVVASVGLMGLAVQPALSANVKMTPLGSHDGEFCLLDRAMVFEDSDGTRILYDAGRTVRGPDDPRLGKIDGVLLSHVHWDHLGDLHSAEANSG